MALTGLPEPNLSVRFSKDTPHSLMQDSAKLDCKGFGMPSIFCDEVVIPAMMTLGLSEEVAREYCSMGWWGNRYSGTLGPPCYRNDLRKLRQNP
jgi:formate C-acetyltransferase